jgi:glyoxylase I family protein
MFRRIDHVEIIPSDFEKTIAFYTEILGFRQRERKRVDNPPRGRDYLPGAR